MTGRQQRFAQHTRLVDEIVNLHSHLSQPPEPQATSNPTPALAGYTQPQNSETNESASSGSSSRIWLRFFSKHTVCEFGGSYTVLSPLIGFVRFFITLAFMLMSVSFPSAFRLVVTVIGVT